MERIRREVISTTNLHFRVSLIEIMGGWELRSIFKDEKEDVNIYLKDVLSMEDVLLLFHRKVDELEGL